MNRAVARWLAVIGATFVLCACNALQFSYNNAEGLLRYMAWDCCNVDSEQADSLQQRFVRLREWHRSNELPAYIALLQTARSKVSKGLTLADIEWASAILRSNYRALALRAVQDAAPVLVTLKADQIAALERRLAKDDARYVEQWINGETKARHRKRVERMVERFEEWTGDLDAKQRARIETFVASHSAIYERRIEERRRWQREALALLRKHKTAEDLVPPLGGLFAEPESFRTAVYAAEALRWESDLAALIVALDATLTAEQRARVLRRMDRYADDFRSLSGKGRSS